MNTYANAGEGLRKMYVSMVGTIICVIISLIPYIGVVGSIGSFVCGIISLVGLYHIGKDIKGCQVAFILQMISVIVSVAAKFVSVLAFLDLITGLLPFVSEILLLVSVTKVLREQGAAFLSGIVFFAVALVDFSGMLVLILLGSVILFVLSIATVVFYLRFLRNSAQQFGVYV